MLPKVKHFVRRDCVNALATNDNLYRRKCKSSSTCSFCSHDETTEHLLLHCEWAKGVWFSALGMNIGVLPYDRVDKWLWHTIEFLAKSGSDWKDMMKQVFLVMCYIWKHCTEVVFQNKILNLIGVVDRVRKAKKEFNMFYQKSELLLYQNFYNSFSTTSGGNHGGENNSLFSNNNQVANEETNDLYYVSMPTVLAHDVEVLGGLNRNQVGVCLDDTVVLRSSTESSDGSSMDHPGLCMIDTSTVMSIAGSFTLSALDYARACLKDSPSFILGCSERRPQSLQISAMRVGRSVSE